MEEAREWGWRLGIDSGELTGILRKGGSFTNEEKVKIQDYAALAASGSWNTRVWT